MDLTPREKDKLIIFTAALLAKQRKDRGVKFHCVPIIPSLRNNLSSFLGDNGYKAFYSLLAFAGLGLIVYGFSIANSYPLWKPFPYSHAIAVWVMPFSFILLTASSMKTNIKR